MQQMIGEGQVHLVGAGPGDPDLITVKGRRLIERCDALLYDALVNPEMLDWVRPGCRLFFVGKRAGRHCADQRGIEELMVSLALDGHEVVRLKGGDPFVFGRGGEEAEALRHAGIPYTIVPAVTAAVAASSYTGAPLTHRKLSSAVTFLSGHEDPRKEQASTDLRKHAATGATLCFYMAMSRLEAITRELMAGGLPEDTPAVVVQWASTEEQKSLKSTLGDLYKDVVDGEIASPAIVIVGKVAAMASQLSWFKPEAIQNGGMREEVPEPSTVIDWQPALASG